MSKRSNNEATVVSEDGFLLTIAGAARSRTNCPYRVTDAENRFGIARSYETAAADAPDSSLLIQDREKWRSFVRDGSGTSVWSAASPAVCVKCEGKKSR